MEFVKLIIKLLADVVILLGLSVRPHCALAAENLFLREQLAIYKERKVKPPRLDPAIRVSLVLISRLFDW